MCKPKNSRFHLFRFSKITFLIIFQRHFFEKKLVDHDVEKAISPKNFNEQVERTKKAFREKYSFEINFCNEWLRNSELPREKYIPHISQDCGIEEIDCKVKELEDTFLEVISTEDLRSDLEWCWKVAATHFKRREDLKDEGLYRKYFKNYEKFLFIAAKYPSKIIGLGAAHDVDLFWHTHMMHPIAYDKDTERLLPVELFHNPLIEGNDRGTDYLWQAEFGENPSIY